MEKEGLHYLAYSLTLDPAEEIRGAICEAGSKGLQEPGSLDRILAEEPSSGMEAAVIDTPVPCSGNEAAYRTDTVPLPENYKDSGCRAAQDGDDEAEVNYAFDPNPAEREAAAAYEKEVDAKLSANTLKIANVQMHKSADDAERAETYKITQGVAMSFLLYAIKAATF